MTEAPETEVEPLSAPAARVLAFAERMVTDKLGIRDAQQQVVAIEKADLLLVAQGLIDHEMREDEGLLQQHDTRVLDVLESDLSDEAKLSAINELYGIEEFPEEFVRILMAQGLSREQALAALSQMGSAVEAEDDPDIDFGEEVVASEAPIQPIQVETVDTSGKGPAFTVTDTDGARRVIRPIVNENPHVPHVDVDAIIGARTGANGRRDMGGLNEG